MNQHFEGEAGQYPSFYPSQHSYEDDHLQSCQTGELQFAPYHTDHDNEFAAAQPHASFNADEDAQVINNDLQSYILSQDIPEQQRAQLISQQPYLEAPELQEDSQQQSQSQQESNFDSRPDTYLSFAPRTVAEEAYVNYAPNDQEADLQSAKEMSAGSDNYQLVSGSRHEQANCVRFTDPDDTTGLNASGEISGADKHDQGEMVRFTDPDQEDDGPIDENEDQFDDTESEQEYEDDQLRKQALQLL